MNADIKNALRLGSEPAAPSVEISPFGEPRAIYYLGLSKREHIAALMLQGMVSADVLGDRGHADKPGWAKTAVAFADALLLELAE